MHIASWAAAIAAAPALAVAAGSPPPQLFIAPAPPRLHHPVTLDAPQTNAVLASHLGVAHHLSLPVTKGRPASPSGAGADGDWQLALDDDPLTRSPDHARVVVVLECPKSGCTEALPLEFASAPAAATLPALPPHSYLAALTLHLHRLADALGLDPQSPALQGLQDLVDHGVKTVAGWQGWIGDELAAWIGLHGDQSSGRRIRPAVEPPQRASGLLDDLDLLDASAAQLVLELEKVAAIADGAAVEAQARDSDSGPQGAHDPPKVVVLHIQGLKNVAAKHSLRSPTYQRSAALVRDTLTGALSSLRARLALSSSPEDAPTVLLLTLPPYSQPLLRKREAWLKPFEARSSLGAAAKRYGAGAVPGPQQHKKRSVFSPRADDDNDDDGAEPTLVVSAGKTCFSSLEALNNATASCLGHGRGVRGISTRQVEGDACWVCQCQATVDDQGRRTRWAGEGCEKEDRSGSAVLLAGTTIFLGLLIAGSVALLYNVGEVPLPGTLSAVSGMGPGSAKRD